MRRTFYLIAAGLVGPCGMLSAQAAAAPDLKWGPAPPVFPAGAQMAVVSGDPGKAGPFVIEVSLPAGYKIMPHFHPTDEKVTVDKGTFLVGMGDTFNASKTSTMTKGATGEIKAGMHHYAMAKDATLITIASTGPFAMTYVNPADDPTKMMAKP